MMVEKQIQCSGGGGNQESIGSDGDMRVYTTLYNLGSEERCQQLEGNVKSTKSFFVFPFTNIIEMLMEMIQ